MNLCRMLLSVTFILSGIVKLIDPVGTQYKIEDYAQAFGLSALLPGFVPLLLAVGLAFIEFDLHLPFLRLPQKTRIAFLSFVLGTDDAAYALSGD